MRAPLYADPRTVKCFEAKRDRLLWRNSGHFDTLQCMTVLTEIVEDRRRVPRCKRLLTLSLTYVPSTQTSVKPEAHSIVTTDVSLTGAFLSLTQQTLPPRGSQVILESLQEDRTIRIEAFVVRTVQRTSFLQRDFCRFSGFDRFTK